MGRTSGGCAHSRRHPARRARRGNRTPGREPGARPRARLDGADRAALGVGTAVPGARVRAGERAHLQRPGARRRHPHVRVVGGDGGDGKRVGDDSRERPAGKSSPRGLIGGATRRHHAALRSAPVAARRRPAASADRGERPRAPATPAGHISISPNHQSYIDSFLVAGTLPFRVFRQLFFVERASTSRRRSRHGWPGSRA